MGRICLRLNPSKTECLWIFGPLGLGELIFLTLDGLTFSWTELGCNFRIPRLVVPPGKWQLFRWTYAQIHLIHPLCLFLYWEALLMVTHIRHLQLIYYNHSTWGYPWRLRQCTVVAEYPVVCPGYTAVVWATLTFNYFLSVIQGLVINIKVCMAQDQAILRTIFLWGYVSLGQRRWTCYRSLSLNTVIWWDFGGTPSL